jgi:hypothetical protein
MEFVPDGQGQPMDNGMKFAMGAGREVIPSISASVYK